MSYQRIDDDIVLAYVDNQLDAVQRAEINAQLAAIPELHAEVATVQRLQCRLRAAFEVVDYLPVPHRRPTRTARRDRTRRLWLAGMIGVVVSMLIVATFITAQSITTPMLATQSFSTLVPLPPPSAKQTRPFTVTKPLPTGQLVFATLRDPAADGGCGRFGIYLLTSNTTPTRHLANGCNPVLSPNNQLVAYVRAGQLWVVDTAGDEERSVSDDGIVDGRIFPAWSADSRWIAFKMGRGGQTDIYRVNIDSGQLVRLTNSAAVAEDWTAFTPVWSPDGRQLAMIGSTNPWEPEENWDVYVMQGDGSELTRLTEHPAREGPIAWSPDGTRLLFWSDRDGESTNVYLMQTDGSQMMQVTHGVYDSRASWSPDGTQITLASIEDGQIYIANIERHTIKPITTGLPHSYNPIWSDDGQYIFFGAFADNGHLAWIYRVRPDGQQLAPLITTTNGLQWTQR
ncbi:MAG: hypothetical protein MI924_15470 [Chloroflexales bacterium]|nr:hypothetical protein [Chloroflexales bacterium]